MSISALRSQLRQIKRVVDEDLRTDVVAERLWLGLSTREDVIALELDPDRRTGKPRPGAPALALKILDTVTCPMLVRERRQLPPPRNAYCWQVDGWTIDELLAFFEWLDSPDPDLYDLDDDTASRYREQLGIADRAWAGDRIVATWMGERVSDGTSPDESLSLLRSPPDREELLAELEVAADSLGYDL